MSFDKDVRFAEKKSDESWKDQVAKDKGTAPVPPPVRNLSDSGKPQPQSSPAFMGLLNSLAYQVLYHLGEAQGGGEVVPEPDLPAAKEIIDILLALKIKSQGNLSPEEARFFETLLPEIQMKFVQKS